MKQLLFFLLTSTMIFAQKDPKIFGHRGIRGTMPENSIPGFLKTIELGADGIEWDVCVNKDKQLVVSHEPYFQGEYCRLKDGTAITDEKKNNIYTMTQAEIEGFDCGAWGNPKFKEQQAISITKPLLQDVLKAIESYKGKILFEVKSEKPEYGISQPNPEEFVALILGELKDYSNIENVVFMCFDPEILEELNRQWPSSNLSGKTTLKTVYLTYLPLKSAKKFLAQLSFKPTALGMFYPTVSKRKIAYLHKNDILMYSWTINNLETAQKLYGWGVDGIITDYCDRITKQTVKL
ncbi:MAG: glycerophosphodiester phosphodiesterase family protein [Bacteroidota bacterium]